MNQRQAREPILKREVIMHYRAPADEQRSLVAMIYVALGSMALVALMPIVLVALMHNGAPLTQSTSMPTAFSMSSPMSITRLSPSSTGYGHQATVQEVQIWRGLSAHPGAYGVVLTHTARQVFAPHSMDAVRAAEPGLATALERLDSMGIRSVCSFAPGVEPTCYGPTLYLPGDHGHAVQAHRSANIE